MYPRVMYHPTKGPRLVESPEQEEALGNEWSRTPFPADAMPETPADDPIAALTARVEALEAQVAELRSKPAAKSARPGR